MKPLYYTPLMALAISLVPSKNLAQSNKLEPAESYFSSFDFQHEYRTKIRNILLKGITDTPDAMLVTLASFSSESAIVLEEEKLIVLRCSKPIWNNKNPEKIKVTKISTNISKELAAEVHKLWFESLRTTSYSDESHDGLDGTSYYFTSFRVGLGLRSGTSWSPEDKSLPSELISVAHALQRLGKDRDDKETALLAKVKALTNKIKKDNKRK